MIASPPDSFMRLPQIIGDKKNGVKPVVPVSKTTWYKGVKEGRFPKPIQLTPRTMAWRTSDINKLVEELGK